MSLKRKIDVVKTKVLDDQINLFQPDIEINGDEDSTDDEQLSDSNFSDDEVEDDFQNLNLDSDYSIDDNDEAIANEDDEWSDIDSEDDDNDSAYAGSSKEDSSENNTNLKSGTDASKKSLIATLKKHADASQMKRKKNSESKFLRMKKRSEKRKNMKKEEGDKKPEFDEYEEDSSDEEDLRNTIGNIPVNWYDEYDHLGYGLDSLPVYKPPKKDTLDKFLDKLENPDIGRTVIDKQTGQNVRLSDDHLELVNRLLSNKVPNPKHEMYAPFPDLYSHEVMKMPLSGRPEHKRSFLPSKFERKKVSRLAYLMKRGLYQRRLKMVKKDKKPTHYDLWQPRGEDEPKLMSVTDHAPPPSLPLPGHIDSYNPPPEFLVSRHDLRGLKGMCMGDRKMFQGFWRQFKSIRDIPGYEKLVMDRFNRLMDLYLAPRKKYQKIVAQSKDLLPDLPNKKDLRPYPTMEGIKFEGHRSIIRSISVHPGGKYLASGSDDHTVRVWEISTGRCLRTFEMEEAVKKVAWNPNPKLFLLGIAMGTMVVFLNPETYLTDKLIVEQTNSIFKEEIDQGDYIAPARVLAAVKWRKPTQQEWEKGYRVVLDHFKEVKEVVWHGQGDYFATVIPEGAQRSVLTHQLSRWRSQLPFQRNKGRIQTVVFHPKLPQLVVVSQSHIRVYDLKRQLLLKKIQGNSRFISCIAMHPGGEHFIIGTFDRRVNWFEMECTKRPHLMRFHAEAVRSVSFHRKYPLYASCSDDKRVVVTHGMVYDDWLKDPLIVPLKQLKGHMRFDDLYVLDLTWHPHEPFLFTAGADATIRLWH